MGERHITSSLSISLGLFSLSTVETAVTAQDANE